MLLRLLLVFFFYFFFLALPNHGGTCTQSGPIPHAIRTNPLPCQKNVVILHSQSDEDPGKKTSLHEITTIAPHYLHDPCVARV